MNLKEIAEKGRRIEDEIGIDTDAVLNKLTQEVGEFNDAVQKYRGIYCRQKSENLNHIKEEAGDLMFNLISVCHRLGVNPNELQNYAENTLRKFEERKELYIKNIK